MTDNNLAALTEYQKTFLGEYSIHGNAQQAMTRLDVTLDTFIEWCKNPVFDQAYRKRKREYMAHLRDQMALMSIHNMFEAISQGKIIERSTKITTVKHPNGTVKEFRQDVTITEKAVPRYYLEYALTRETIADSMQNFVSRGLIPAQKQADLAEMLDDVERKLSEFFEQAKIEGEDQKQQYAQFVNMIKHAVLGNENE